MANYTLFKKRAIPYLRKNLSKDLAYHGLHHTLEVLENALEIVHAEQMNASDIKLLKTAVILHDCGFIEGYENHEELGCTIACRLLPHYNYKKDEIEVICGMIMATRIPQNPQNILERIIADADLMYLGTDQYDEISQTLFEELKNYNRIKDEKQWLDIQISFLESHHFWTDYCINTYSKKKQLNLKKLKTYHNGFK